MSFLEELAKAVSQEEREDLPHDKQISRLRDMLALYRQPNPFVPGDLVTARKDMNVKGAGQPHIVLEINPNAAPEFTENAGNSNNGMRFDLRIGCMAGNDTVSYWVESYCFEPYRTN